jgi:NADP-dependent 3-hydroxy acid dehydrogenase YdfG
VSGAFDGLAALVTGASSGIGRATALALADAGASVVAVARRAERLDGVVAEIEAAGGSAVAAVADVSDEDAAATAATRAVEMFGGLDVLVANAGAMLLGPVGGPTPRCGDA